MTTLRESELREMGISIDWTCDTVGSAEIRDNGETVAIVSGCVGRKHVLVLAAMVAEYLADMKKTGGRA